MPNNVHINPQIICDMAAIRLGAELGKGYMANMSKTLTKEFAKKDYKVGDTVEFYKPYRLIAKDGLGWDPQALVDQIGTATISRTASIQFGWGIVEKTLEVREAMELYVQPVVDALRGKMAPEAARFCTQNAFNSVGSPGVAPTGTFVYTSAKDTLVELGLPASRIPKAVVNRRMSSAFVNGVQTLYNPTDMIAAQMKKGEITSNTLGMDIYQDQSAPVVTNGIYAGTPLVNGAQSADGGNNATMNLITDGWSSTTLNKNTKFTIGSSTSATVSGVNSVHPTTRQDTGRQQVFSVTQDDVSDSAGAIAALPIAPAITPSGQYQNVTIAAPDNGIITIIGLSAQTMQQGILMDPKAFGLLSVPLQKLPEGGGTKCYQSTDPMTGFSILHTQFNEGQTLNQWHRYDILYDFYKAFPEMATVIQA